jgi:hypothetical protein
MSTDPPDAMRLTYYLFLPLATPVRGGKGSSIGIPVLPDLQSWLPPYTSNPSMTMISAPALAMPLEIGANYAPQQFLPPPESVFLASFMHR